jgi:hypothetical protein
MSRSYFWRSWRLSTHKSVEVQLTRWDSTPRFEVRCDRRRKCDHPGIELSVTLFGYELSIDYHDHRHWDHERNAFEETP